MDSKPNAARMPSPRVRDASPKVSSTPLMPPGSSSVAIERRPDTSVLRLGRKPADETKLKLVRSPPQPAALATRASSPTRALRSGTAACSGSSVCSLTRSLSRSLSLCSSSASCCTRSSALAGVMGVLGSE
eukprot:scaffold71506_cov48-Phaeocystis_antarctica.AAC.2